MLCSHGLIKNMFAFSKVVIYSKKYLYECKMLRTEVFFGLMRGVNKIRFESSVAEFGFLVLFLYIFIKAVLQTK